MFVKRLAFLALTLCVLAPALPARAADDVTNVVVGDWKTGKGSVNSVVIQGEDIYLDGVLQKEKYKPGMDVSIRDGHVALIPHDAAKAARKAEEKAQAKAARDEEKAALKAQAKADKEALKASVKAQAKADKEAIKREAAEGLEKGTIKTQTGQVINKGGTVRIGNKDYPSSGPATEKDIPPDARQAIEDAKNMKF